MRSGIVGGHPDGSRRGSRDQWRITDLPRTQTIAVPHRKPTVLGRRALVLGEYAHAVSEMRLGFRPAAAIPDLARGFAVGALLLTAVIGVVAVLLPTGTPLGFVAILGIIALTGMIIRNSVILIVQIEDHRRAGMPACQSVVDAVQHRFRPILLTASAAILGMVPIMSEVFWGPMAFAIVGGLVAATLLTVLFLPALYVAWFRVRETEGETETAKVDAVPAR